MDVLYQSVLDWKARISTLGAITMITYEPRESRLNKTQCRLRLLTLRIGLACGLLLFVPTAQADIFLSESFETDGQGSAVHG